MPIRRLFRISLFRRRDVVRDVDDEIAFHIAMRETRLQGTGMSPGDAARIARARFGDVTGIRDECLDESHRIARRERAMMWIDELRRDVTVATRSLRRA